MWFLVMEEEEEETTPRRAHLHRMRAWCVMYWSAEPGEDKEARQAEREREQGSDENRRCLERERKTRGDRLFVELTVRLCCVCVCCGDLGGVWRAACRRAVMCPCGYPCLICVSSRIVLWRRARVIVLRLGRLESFASRAPLMDKLSVAVGAVCVGAGRSL